MSKVSEEYKDPIDLLLLGNTSNNFLDVLYSLGVTPNILTTLSNIFRGFALYFLFSGKKLLFVILFILGYYFDVLDGHFARRYQMFSKFGDFYDHFSDAIFGFILVYYLFKWSSLPNSKYYWPVIIFYVLTEILMFTNVGCIQKIQNSPNPESQDIYKALCAEKEWIHFTRYFGSGPNILKTVALATIF